MDQIDYAIVLDVGGTSVKSGVVGQESTVVNHQTLTPVDSNGGADAILSTLAGIIRQHAEQVGEGRLFGIVLAFPGPFDYGSGVSYISGLSKYSALFKLNINRELRKRLPAGDCPLRFCNDAEAAVVGECFYGSGRGYERVIGITLGTGFGSTFAVQGVPQISGDGIPPNGWLYPMPVGSTRADDCFSVRGLKSKLQQYGSLPEEPELAAREALAGNESAKNVFIEFGRALGTFLSPYVADFRADVVIVLGGISQSFDLFGPSLSTAVNVPVLTGQKGPDAALLGAARLLQISAQR